MITKIKPLLKHQFSIAGSFDIEKSKLLGYFSLFLVIVIIIVNFVRLVPRIYKSFVGMNKQIIFSSNEDKLKRKIGYKVIDYYEFIKRNTPENAVILIPPQAMPWPMTGNAAYSRYFLYPRHLISGKEKEPGLDLKKEDVQYILIDWGEVNLYQYGYTHGWPKFFVPAKKIIYKKTLNEINNFDAIILEQDFDAEDINPEFWGLIEVDKTRL